MTLYDGIEKGKYIVESIDLDIKTKKRLQDMGITQGVAIKILSKLGKHAYILRIRGSRVALGKEITANIYVKEYSAHVCVPRKDQPCKLK
jgi:ferrous iron transport protein A